MATLKQLYAKIQESNIDMKLGVTLSQNIQWIRCENPYGMEFLPNDKKARIKTLKRFFGNILNYQEEEIEEESPAIDHEQILSDAMLNLPSDMFNAMTTGYVNEADENDGRYEEEFILRVATIFDMTLEAGGWFSVDEDGDVSCTLTLALNGDWKNNLLGEYGCISGWYNADSKTWSFAQDTF